MRRTVSKALVCRHSSRPILGGSWNGVCRRGEGRGARRELAAVSLLATRSSTLIRLAMYGRCDLPQNVRPRRPVHASVVCWGHVTTHRPPPFYVVRHSLAAAGAAVGFASRSEAIEPITRVAGPHFKFSLAAYSYRDLLLGPNAKLTLADFIDDCARFDSTARS